MGVTGDAERKLNKELYIALMKGEAHKVIEICVNIPNGPLHTMTLHHDTVLHVAAYYKLNNLFLDLLALLPESRFHKLACQNDIGNTILQEAATSDRMVLAAREMLRMAPTLLSMPNRHGETPIFRAARYGKMNMYQLLDAEISKTVQRDADLRTFHVRDDKSTILHVSLLYEHFDLALHIAQKYVYLVGERDEDGMTALQLLACSPSAFKGTNESFCQSTTFSLEPAMNLAMFLIEKDTSWESSDTALAKSRTKTHRYGRYFTAPSHLDKDHKGTTIQELVSVNIPETPLFLATKSGCTEIVRGILEMYPQAIEHVDDHGRTILHLAIKYRKIRTFDLVAKMENPMRRLIRKVDNNGNSILHMVGIRAQDQGYEDMRSPALILQEDLLLFERVKRISTIHIAKIFNSHGQTAEMLFAANNAQLRVDAKDWMKSTAENSSIIAVLIATVAFAAAYTIPGGPDQTTGYPILENKRLFTIFTMTDVISLTLSLTSVVTFLSILTSTFQLKDFQHVLPQRLMLGITLLVLSVTMMMVAFAATVLIWIHNREKWTRIAVYSVVFFPVTIFACSYFPLYISLLQTFKYPLKWIVLFFLRAYPSQSVTSYAAAQLNPSPYSTNVSTPQTRPHRV